MITPLKIFDSPKIENLNIVRKKKMYVFHNILNPDTVSSPYSVVVSFIRNY